MEKYFH